MSYTRRIMTHSHLVTPTVTGAISAGEPSLMYETDTEMVDLNTLLAHGDCLLLTIGGESMNPTIRHGDHVICDLARRPRDGDIVVALTEGGYSVKSFKETPNLRLVPKNPEYPTIEPADLSIVGVVRYIIAVPVLLGVFSFVRIGSATLELLMAF